METAVAMAVSTVVLLTSATVVMNSSNALKNANGSACMQSLRGQALNQINRDLAWSNTLSYATNRNGPGAFSCWGAAPSSNLAGGGPPNCPTQAIVIVDSNASPIFDPTGPADGHFNTTSGYGFDLKCNPCSLGGGAVPTSAACPIQFKINYTLILNPHSPPTLGNGFYLPPDVAPSLGGANTAGMVQLSGQFNLYNSVTAASVIQDQYGFQVYRWAL